MLVGELLDDFDGPEVFFELAGLGSTEKYGGDIWILNAPRESKLGNRRIEVFFGKGLKLCDFIERSGCFVAIEHTYQEAIAWLRKARAFWNAIVVFTGENTRSQRAPDGGAYIVGRLVERVVFGFEAIPLEHAVLRLLKLRRLEPEVRAIQNASVIC